MVSSPSPPIPWGDGTPIPGTPFRVAVPAEATGGHAVCITVDMPPGIRVEEHTHPNEDQICIVLAGRIGTRVGRAAAILDAGSIQVLPRGIPHELWNAGDDFARLIELYTPPGMEQRFARAGQEALNRGLTAAGGDEYATQ